MILAKKIVMLIKATLKPFFVLCYSKKQRGKASECDKMRDLIDSLPPHYRIVVLLRHQQDLSYEEIAGILHLPLGTVKARIHRARALLKQRLEGETS